MAITLTNNSILTQIIDEYSAGFEFMGFKVIHINPDLDFFNLQVTLLEKYKNSSYDNDLESLLIGSLELFNRILFQTQVHDQSSNYYLNLHPLPNRSKKLQIQIDYLTTIDTIVCLEAYCYDEKEVLIAKGGIIYHKKAN